MLIVVRWGRCGRDPPREPHWDRTRRNRGGQRRRVRSGRHGVQMCVRVGVRCCVFRHAWSRPIEGLHPWRRNRRRSGEEHRCGVVLGAASREEGIRCVVTATANGRRRSRRRRSKDSLGRRNRRPKPTAITTTDGRCAEKSGGVATTTTRRMLREHTGAEGRRDSSASRRGGRLSKASLRWGSKCGCCWNRHHRRNHGSRGRCRGERRRRRSSGEEGASVAWRVSKQRSCILPRLPWHVCHTWLWGRRWRWMERRPGRKTSRRGRRKWGWCRGGGGRRCRSKAKGAGRGASKKVRGRRVRRWWRHGRWHGD
mmetsp:Transcript_22709/g.66109  ORF Transcript_22709/g.66109 Transcript_22709/m.66109 type:complete len:311 (-) Transcript_22709:95-1027(-)